MKSTSNDCSVSLKISSENSGSVPAEKPHRGNHKDLLPAPDPSVLIDKVTDKYRNATILHRIRKDDLLRFTDLLANALILYRKDIPFASALLAEELRRIPGITCPAEIHTNH